MTNNTVIVEINVDLGMGLVYTRTPVAIVPYHGNVQAVLDAFYANRNTNQYDSDYPRYETFEVPVIQGANNGRLVY